MSKKTIILIIIGFVLSVFVWKSNNFLINYFNKSEDILISLNKIQKDENELNYRLLESNIFLYFNNDLIAEQVHKLKSETDKLLRNEYFQKYYPDAYKEFVMYENAMNKKSKLIFEFQCFNFPLKNSIMNFFVILRKAPKVITNKKYLNYVNSVISYILLSKYAIDASYLNEISKEKFELNSKEKEFNKIFKINLSLYLKLYPKYQTYFNYVFSIPTKKYIAITINKFNAKNKYDMKIFNILSYVLIGFINILIIIMIHVIYKLEKSINEITYIANYDLLTNLANRNKFIMDVKNYKNPCFILFNIDKFQHINDIFGIQAGDEVLKFVAKELSDYCKKYESCEVYRIGADDFGILLENINDTKAYVIAQDFIDSIEKKYITLNGIEYNISLSAGISFEKRHLIETADSALKYVKKDRQKKIIFYKHEINNKLVQNLQKLITLKEAIKNNNIIPVFQGIYDKNKNLIKYEVLARIKNNDKLELIYPYLQIAKENKLYHYISEQIFSKVYKILQKENINVSLNISMEDMENTTIKNKIFEMLKDKEIAKKITFEVLESEIANYENVIEFLKLIKNKGSLIAIDDFGSGYSNFERILALDVDYIKIDGSLIKNILTDKNSRLIVELIIDFAKKVNKKTVAEFVSSKEIFEECKKLGIDYFQGFYIDESKVRFDSDKIQI